jgi:hypothetical protein
VGVPEAERAAFRPAFPADTDPPLTRRETALQRSIAQRTGAQDQPAENTIYWLQAQIDALMKRESADKARQERIKVIQTRNAAIDTEIARIQAEIAQIEGPERERMVAAQRERMEVYVAYFANLKREQEMLEELYAPVTARLQSESASAQEQDLEFSIRWEADVANWLERGGVLFDQRKAIPYGTMQGLADAARKTVAPAWASGDPDQIGPALDQFLVEFRKRELPPVKYLRTGVTVQDILEWLYEVDHVRLNYGLKYNGVELEKLSPAARESCCSFSISVWTSPTRAR